MNLERAIAIDQKTLFSRFFLAVIASFSIVLFINLLLDRQVHAFFNAYSYSFNRVYVLLVALPFYTLFIVNRHPISLLGFENTFWKKSIIEGIVLTLFLIGALCMAKIWWMLNQGSTILDNLDKIFTVPSTYAYSYIASVIIQQNIRSFFQNYLHEFLDKQSNVWSCAISSFLFGIMHVHFGMQTAILTFLMGLLFSWIYIRHNNIYGLTIIHTVVGIAAFSTRIL